MVAYCDMFLTIDMVRFFGMESAAQCRRGCYCLSVTNPMDPYAEIDAKGRVVQTAEKILISDTATAGLYYFRRGRDFVSAARTMLTNGRDQSVELFVNPCFNELIRRGKTVLAYSICHDEKIEMGTPDDLRRSRLWLDQAAVQTTAR